MPIKVTCSNCGGVLHAPDDAGGKRGRCPTCGNILPIPAVAGSGGGQGLPDAPSGGPGQRPPSFADFASGPQVGPPPSAEAPPRGAAKASLPYASAAEAPPQRAARPAEAREPRRAADPFARKASFAGPAASGEPASQGVVKAWRRCRGGLGWVQAAMVFLFIPVVLLPGYFVANEVMKASSNADPKPDLIPFKNPGFVGVQGLNSHAELWVAAGAIPVVLALLCTLFGRLGTAGAPKRSAVGGPAILSALATLVAVCGLVALIAPNVFNAIFGGEPFPAGKLLMDYGPGEFPGVIQRFALFIGIGAAVVGEFWFASAVGRVGAALADGRTAARSTRYQMLLGLVAIGLIGTAAVAPSDNFGLWSPQYDSPNSGEQFSEYTGKKQVAVNPVHQAGEQTNDLVAERWQKFFSPRFGVAGAYQPVIMPAAFLLCGLIVWLLYVRMVGAARGAIRGWLDAHAGA